MKTFVLFISLFCLITINNLAAHDRDIYLNMLKNRQFSEMENHLLQWQEKDSNNPELYIAFFNYYLQRNMKSGLAIDKSIDTSKPHMVITDPDTGEIVGYMGDRHYYDFNDVERAFEYLDTGLTYGPDRLDMYFGKAHVLQEIGEFERQSRVLIQALHKSIENNNNWKWTLDEPVRDSLDFFLNNMQNYYHYWFQIGSAESMQAILDTATVQTELYPDNLIGINNLSMYYIQHENFTKALELLLTGHELDKNDHIIIANIGMLYLRLDQNNNAITYFTMLLDSDDPGIVRWAEDIISEIGQ